MITFAVFHGTEILSFREFSGDDNLKVQYLLTTADEGIPPNQVVTILA